MVLNRVLGPDKHVGVSLLSQTIRQHLHRGRPGTEAARHSRKNELLTNVEMCKFRKVGEWFCALLTPRCLDLEQIVDTDNQNMGSMTNSKQLESSRNGMEIRASWKGKCRGV